jgi:hypothetical protein
MPELFQISWSHSGMGKKVGSMDLVRLSGGLVVKTKSEFFFLSPCQRKQIQILFKKM